MQVETQHLTSSIFTNFFFKNSIHLYMPILYLCVYVFGCLGITSSQCILHHFNVMFQLVGWRTLVVAAAKPWVKWIEAVFLMQSGWEISFGDMQSYEFLLKHVSWHTEAAAKVTHQEGERVSLMTAKNLYYLVDREINKQKDRQGQRQKEQKKTIYIKQTSVKI